MNVRTLLIPTGTALISFVANSPLWLFPRFAKQDMEVPILTWWLLATFAVALVAAFFTRRRFTERFFCGALPAFVGVQGVVLGRIVLDTVFVDPTSHNLAPFEFIFAAFPAGAGAVVGGFVGACLGLSFLPETRSSVEPKPEN